MANKNSVTRKPTWKDKVVACFSWFGYGCECFLKGGSVRFAVDMFVETLKGNFGVVEEEEAEAEKTKVTKADIVVKGTIDKPYYVIVYHEVGNAYNTEGFGSYYLDNVFKWREQYLEVVDGEAEDVRSVTL